MSYTNAHINTVYNGLIERLHWLGKHNNASVVHSLNTMLDHMFTCRFHNGVVRPEHRNRWSDTWGGEGGGGLGRYLLGLVIMNTVLS